MRYAYGDHMGGGGDWVFMIAMVLLVVLAILAVVWFLHNQGTKGPAAPSDMTSSPRDLLDRRLVSGDITEDEYRRLRAALSDTHEPGPPPAVA
jgi:uncharacterized membrane protein